MTYIAFEGIEGCGKSTQAKRLADRIGAVLTRENGGTPLGQEIRKITHGFDGHIEPWAEACLFAADRAQHVAEVVQPALDEGRHVVSDRSVFSSMAYQGGGRGIGALRVGRLNEMALPRWPNIVVYITIDRDVAESRISQRNLDRIEREGSAFFDRVEQAFETLCLVGSSYAEPRWGAKWIKVNGNQSQDDVEAEIFAKLTEGRWL